MTREQAKELFRNDRNSYGGVKSPMSKIDKIYNDFEIQNEMLDQCTQRCKLQKNLIYELELKVKKLESKNIS